MSDFTAIQPDAMAFALVNNDAAAIAEYAPEHKMLAFGAFDIFDGFISLETIAINIVELPDIDVVNVADRLFQHQLYFAGIKKQSKAIATTVYLNGTVELQFDGLQRFAAMRARSAGHSGRQWVGLTPGEIDIIASVAILAAIGIGR